MPLAFAAAISFSAPPRSRVRLRSAPDPGARAGGEDDRVGLAKRGRHVLLRLEVAIDRLGPGGLHVVGLIRVPDERARFVAPADEQRVHGRDLAVPACDDDAHDQSPFHSRAQSRSWRRAGCSASPLALSA